MEFAIDLNKMTQSMKMADADTGELDLIETEGEQYIVDNIFKKLLNERAVRVSDIDFDAFEEDDIVNIIDNKLYSLENRFRGVEKIAKFFMGAPPITLSSRQFF